MVSPITMMKLGGPAMYGLLLMGMVAPPVFVLTAVILGALKKRLPISVGLLPVSLATVVMLGGIWFGLSLTESALANASPEMKQTLLANGISISMYSTAGWCMSILPTLVVGSVVCSAVALFSAGPDASADRTALLYGVGGTVVGTLVSGVLAIALVGMNGFLVGGPGMFFICFVAALGMVPLYASALRISDEEPHAARTTGVRMLTGALIACAITVSGELFRVLGVILTFEAVANAPAEQKQTFFQNGMEISVLPQWLGWSMVWIPLCTVLGFVLAHRSKLGPREGVGTAVASTQFLFIFVAPLIAAWMAESVFGRLF